MLVRNVNCGPSDVWPIDCDAVISVNEVQQVTFSGNTTLIFNGPPTSSLGVASTAAQVRAALEALAGIGVGNVTVTGSAPGPFTITFVNALEGTNVGPLTAGTPANATIVQVTPGSRLAKTGDRTPDTTWDGTVPYAVDECDLTNEAEQRERTTNLLRLQERVKVENHVAAELATRAPAPVAASSLIDALSKLDDLMAPFGFTGVIHARPGLVNEAASLQLLDKVGATLQTPGGHKWAFGSGYTLLAEDTLYATGPVVIHRGPIETQSGLDVAHNVREVVSERDVVVAWECFTFAVTIS